MISRAPCRISFAGGGTDLFAYADKYGGCCLAVAIKRYVTVYDYQTTLPMVPMGSGLGSSGAQDVARMRLAFPDLTRIKLAQVACQIENMGQQDQAIAALGGFKWLEFSKGSITIEEIPIPSGFEDHIAIVYLGEREFKAKEILALQKKAIKAGVNLRDLDDTKAIAYAMKKAILSEDYDGFCYLINEAWKVKRKHTPFTTTPEIDSYKEKVMQKGVLAFKICGAGNGGYALLVKPPDLDIGERVEFDMQGVRLTSNNIGNG